MLRFCLHPFFGLLPVSLVERLIGYKTLPHTQNVVGRLVSFDFRAEPPSIPDLAVGRVQSELSGAEGMKANGPSGESNRTKVKSTAQNKVEPKGLKKQILISNANANHPTFLMLQPSVSLRSPHTSTLPDTGPRTDRPRRGESVSKQFLANVSLMTAALLTGPWLALHAATPLVFQATPPVNDLQGPLAAQVLFAQSQILPAHPREGDNQPHLTSLRQSLLLVRPLKTDDATPMSVVVRNALGTPVGSLDLNPPKLLPKTAYFVDGAPEDEIDFTPPGGSTATVTGRSELEKLSDQNGVFLLGELQRHSVIEIETADGQWVRDIYLPPGKGLDGRMVRAKSQAGYGSTIHYSGRQVALSRGENVQFKCVNGQWFREGDLENNAITYAEDAWSGVLAAEWIVPGMTLQFRQGNLTGELTGLKVGAPSQLLIHTIDVGMLTTPRGEFAFAGDPEAHREYFQTVPASRLIVSQYAPLSLPEVMMPNGRLLTDLDESEGGWHTGNMRQSIGKELISHGIDNANYGIHSTPGQGENSHPYVAAQLAAHNNRGKYSNGIQVHGGSGGGGIVTLDHSIGNEFSHEVGHNYGLGHYVDGFKGSVHRSADQVNSTWGWDADKNRFIPNFAPTQGGKDTCLDNQCQAPFDGRAFGLDAMAGGAPFSGFNRFTLYTPNSAAIIQRFLESKAVFDANSSTGFSKWNDSTSRMEPYHHRIDVSRKTSASIEDLNEANLAAMLNDYEVVTVAMADGRWTRDIPLPPALPANRGRVVSIDHNAAYASVLLVNGQKVDVARGFKKSYVSDGKRWNEGAEPDPGIERKPQHFGVPVVTLIGYYDPAGQLPTYIYPTLHGAYGFCYGDDSSTLNTSDCELQVETRTGVLRFRLANSRLAGARLGVREMNKFHVNVPESSQPSRIAVMSRGKILDKEPITPVTEELTVTVNGIPVSPEPPNVRATPGVPR